MDGTVLGEHQPLLNERVVAPDHQHFSAGESKNSHEHARSHGGHGHSHGGHGHLHGGHGHSHGPDSHSHSHGGAPCSHNHAHHSDGGMSHIQQIQKQFLLMKVVLFSVLLTHLTRLLYVTDGFVFLPLQDGVGVTVQLENGEQSSGPVQFYDGWAPWPSLNPDFTELWGDDVFQVRRPGFSDSYTVPAAHYATLVAYWCSVLVFLVPIFLGLMYQLISRAHVFIMFVLINASMAAELWGHGLRAWSEWQYDVCADGRLSGTALVSSAYYCRSTLSVVFVVATCLVTHLMLALLLMNFSGVMGVIHNPHEDGGRSRKYPRLLKLPPMAEGASLQDRMRYWIGLYAAEGYFFWLYNIAFSMLYQAHK